jgi:sporulation protein YlmC with PRC-barrel domain
MLRIKKISAMIGKRVFTDTGDLFGEIEEVILAENKIDSWRIRISKDMAKNLNGARGVVIPHQFVKAIGDVFVINAASLPISDIPEGSEGETMDLSAANSGESA